MADDCRDRFGGLRASYVAVTVSLFGDSTGQFKPSLSPG
jgi:hypothetical protein